MCKSSLHAVSSFVVTLLLTSEHTTDVIAAERCSWSLHCIWVLCRTYGPQYEYGLAPCGKGVIFHYVESYCAWSVTPSYNSEGASAGAILYNKRFGFRFVAISSSATLPSVSKWFTLTFKAIIHYIVKQSAKVSRCIHNAIPQYDISY